MYHIEYTILYLTGHLAGMKFVERLSVSDAALYTVGKIVVSVTGDVYVIVDVAID